VHFFQTLGKFSIALLTSTAAQEARSTGKWSALADVSDGQIARLEVLDRQSLSNWPQGCERLTVGPAGQLTIDEGFLDVRILKIQLDHRRTEAYLHCAGLAGRTALELLFDGDILHNPHAQRYLLVDGLLDGEETLDRIRRLNVGFDLEIDGDALYVTFAEDDSVSSNSPRKIYYLGHLGSEFRKIPGPVARTRQQRTRFFSI
jgi:hypothetical protein